VNASTRQVLGVWADLEDMYAERHGYAGGIVEIYVHTLIPHTPSLGLDSLRSENLIHYQRAKEDFIEIFKLFEERRMCKLEIEHARDEWCSVDEYFLGHVPEHRLHVRKMKRVGHG
jgi:hypothetical protein